MDELRFIWREDKLADVRRKHDVTYGEAVDAVLDPHGHYVEDEIYPDRFGALGKTKAGRLLWVAYAEDETEPPQTYRLITAYDAPKEYRDDYPG